MNLIVSLAFILSVLCFASSASATTLYVSPKGTNDTVNNYPNWAGAATNIQAAVDAAVSNDTILVTNAVYTNFSARVSITKSITVISTNGSGDGATAVIKGGTFQGLYLSSSGAVVVGFTITNCLVPGAANGGGVQIDYGGTLRDCLIVSCSARYGGGVSVYGGVMERCTVRGNYTDNYLGGGIYSYNSTLRDCLIIKNSANGVGGAQSLGGGVYVSVTSLVERCSIVSNRANMNGGGIYLTAGAAQIRNCLIVGNYTYGGIGGGNGAGLYLNAGSVQNCTIARNFADADGGGVYRAGGTVTNSIIYDNSASNNTCNIYGASDTAFGYCCTTGLTHGVNGNITNTPQVVDAGSGYGQASTNGNWRLTLTSPCVNAGLNQSWMTNAVDLDGNRRIMFHGKVDIGAYELFPPKETIFSVY